MLSLGKYLHIVGSPTILGQRLQETIHRPPRASNMVQRKINQSKSPTGR